MYTGYVYICVWEGGGCGVGWGGIVMWVCKQEIDVQVCACVLIAVFLICAYFSGVYAYIYRKPWFPWQLL